MMDNKGIHERVAVTGVLPEGLLCPKCNRLMQVLGGLFQWTEAVCYGDCDAKKAEEKYRARTKN